MGDAEIVEFTGEKHYNVAAECESYGNQVMEPGVLDEDGKKFTLMTNQGVLVYQWIPEDEAEAIKNEGDPIEAPPCPYKLEPERQGKFLWITGPPGLGKSTAAQLLARNAGYVYYEADCFYMGRNPYIPPHAANPSEASFQQNLLVGEGAEERADAAQRALKQFEERVTSGNQLDMEDLKRSFGLMCADIARERKRVGGDWAIATMVDSRMLRDFIRSELGSDLQFVVLEMNVEDGMERIRTRHHGDEDMIQMMKTIHGFCEAAQAEEPNTVGVKVTLDIS